MSATEQEVPVVQPEQAPDAEKPAVEAAAPQDDTTMVTTIDDTPQEPEAAPAAEETAPAVVEEVKVEPTPEPTPEVAPVVEEKAAEPVAAPVVEEKAPEPTPEVAAVEAAPVVVAEEKAVEAPVEEVKPTPAPVEEVKAAPVEEVKAAPAPAAAVATPAPTPAPAPAAAAAPVVVASTPAPAANKWSSDFATRAPAPISLTGSTTPAAAAAKPTVTTSPAATPAVSRTPSATTSTPSTPSLVNQRAAAWNNNQPLQAPKTTDFSRPGSMATPSASNRANGTFSYSNAPLSSAQTGTNAHDARSGGTQQGSLANLLGSSLNKQGVQHKGQFTGLVKARVDPEEERARQELMRNKTTNTSLQSAMRQSICVAGDISAGKRQSVIPSENFLARKMEANATGKDSLFARAKAGQGTNSDGSVVVGDWVEPATSR